MPDGIKNSRPREVFDTYRVMKRAKFFKDAARLNFIQKALTWPEYRDAVANGNLESPNQTRTDRENGVCCW